jgi:serine/threonine protein kinase
LADRCKYKGEQFQVQEFKRIFEALDALPQTLDTGYCVGNFALRKRIDVAEPGCPVRLDVFEGAETVSGEPVEIRLYDTAQRDEETRRFLRRIRRRLIGLRKAKDPHVVSIVGLLDLPEGLLVAFEKPRGSSLTDALHYRGKLPIALSVSLLEHLAATAGRLHERRIFHLDIRPDFIILSNHLESHQGADHFLTGLTNPLIDEAIGSEVVYNNGFDESFAAPELRFARHEDRGRPAVDVFSLGSLLAFCVMGEDYYRARVVKGIVAPNTGSRLLDGIISTATAYRSPQRYQSAVEFRAALAAVR